MDSRATHIVQDLCDLSPQTLKEWSFLVICSVVLSTSDYQGAGEEIRKCLMCVVPESDSGIRGILHAGCFQRVGGRELYFCQHVDLFKGMSVTADPYLHMVPWVSIDACAANH